jgi:hypothetical protein
LMAIREYFFLTNENDGHDSRRSLMISEQQFRMANFTALTTTLYYYYPDEWSQ